jgi:transcriptional regulator with XRE-family HTH domain
MIPPTELDLALGRQIRARRQRAGLSLRQLAARTDLSASFLSQLERGLVRPRITSLHRVARNLDTTAQALLATGDTQGYSLVRRDDAPAVGHDDDDAYGTARSLVRGERGLAALEFRGGVREFGQYYEHPGEELFLVVQGRMEVDLDGDLMELGAGDSLCYQGTIPHRSRAIGPDEPVVLLVTTRDDVQPD